MTTFVQRMSTARGWKITPPPDDDAPRLAASADFDESKHERDEKGRFATKGGGDAPPAHPDVPAQQITTEKAIPQTETPAFKRWFGDSKVVNARGKPLVVYHGTAYDFSEFEIGDWDGGTANPAEDTGLGVFFSSSARDAAWFVQKPTDGYGGRADDKYVKGANVIPAYVRIENPKRYETQADLFRAVREVYHRDGSGVGLRKMLQEEGYDGIIVDDAQRGGNASWYIVFDPKSIKSALGNRGAFDPDDPNITAAADLAAEDAVAAAWDESLHERDARGRFAEKGGSSERAVQVDHARPRSTRADRRMRVGEEARIIHAAKQVGVSPKLALACASISDLLPESAAITKIKTDVHTVLPDTKPTLVVMQRVYGPDADGNEVLLAAVDRGIEVGAKTVHLRMLELHPSVQKQGVGSAHHDAIIAEAKAAGFKKLALAAQSSPDGGEVGGYVWAKLGWDWASPQEGADVLHAYFRWCIKRGYPPEHAELPLTTTPRQLADNTIHGEPTGKQFLLGDITWMAVKHL